MSRDLSIHDEREPISPRADTRPLSRSASDQADPPHTRSTRSKRPSSGFL